jgi:mannose-6-phosphate isomerase-like protein (cupin superfamily)
LNDKAYEVVHLDDLERYPVDDEGLLWRPVRRRLGITAFGTNAYTAEHGTERVVEEHHEQDGHEELYFVASGRATFVLGDEEIDAPAGTFVHAEPGTKRGAVATEPGTTVLAIGAKPGVPHEISAWEEIFVAFGLYRLGGEQKTRALEHLTAYVAANDDAWQGHYNLACLQALTKNRDAAIEELKRAIELDPAAKEYAAKDQDFDWLRDDPEFPA